MLLKNHGKSVPNRENASILCFSVMNTSAICSHLYLQFNTPFFLSHLFHSLVTYSLFHFSIMNTFGLCSYLQILFNTPFLLSIFFTLLLTHLLFLSLPCHEYIRNILLFTNTVHHSFPSLSSLSLSC